MQSFVELPRLDVAALFDGPYGNVVGMLIIVGSLIILFARRNRAPSGEHHRSSAD